EYYCSSYADIYTFVF
nr:immunoglobulin light chain junction region [Macaca mulatta]MOV72672.1 immunoglobulin light chain junction region [Macaca mulatta]MOV72759.1 immunoglobulin light chain junction region [Macaca mulatta]MOV72801.1 immunoglobulin light chain junction region [Macaca mulatta]MOV72833.1 immunoglobulin light chain junction region [Macaca mulatta]